MIVVPPLRKRIGDGPREKVPLTYPSEFTQFFGFFSLGGLGRGWRVGRDVERGRIGEEEREWDVDVDGEFQG